MPPRKQPNPPTSARPAELSPAREAQWSEIVERQQSEPTVRQSAERLAAAFRASPDVLVLSRVDDAVIIDANPSWERMFGFTAAETIGRTCTELELFAEPGERERLLAQVERDGSIRDREVRVRAKSGAIRDTLLSAETLEIEGQRCLLTVLRDITDRKRSERALRDSEERLRVVLSAVRMGTWEWDVARSQITWSGETLRIFGLPPGGFRGTHEAAIDVIHPEDRAATMEKINQFFERADPRENMLVEHRTILPSGEIRWVESQGLLFRDAEGHPLRMLGTVVDITPRKRAEEQVNRYRDELARMGRIKAVGEMASGLAHELNQPLTAISVQAGLAAALARSGGAASITELQSRLDEIAAQAKRAGDIVRVLREFMRKGTFERTSVPLNDVIREVITIAEPQLRQHRVRLTLELNELPNVSIDRIQIGQLLINLIQNAVEAMTLTEPDQRALTVTSALDGDGVLVSVHDEGQGIPAEDLTRIFDSFYTTKPDGIGMGLAICRSIAEAHGGRLWATSQLGAGATFCLRLPLGNCDS
jgi:PAS domain S-box-containing protein